MLLLLKWPKNTEIAKHDLSMSRTAITLKFKMRWFPNEAILRKI